MRNARMVLAAVSLLFVTAAWGDDFEQGLYAYNSADYETALACYNSADYQEAAKIRMAHSDSDFVLVEGT